MLTQQTARLSLSDACCAPGQLRAGCRCPAVALIKCSGAAYYEAWYRPPSPFAAACMCCCLSTREVTKIHKGIVKAEEEAVWALAAAEKVCCSRAPAHDA